MNVLDTTNVVNGINPDSAPQRLARNVVNVVAFVLACIDALIRIQEFQIECSRVLATHSDGSRIRNGIFVGKLLGIVNG